MELSAAEKQQYNRHLILEDVGLAGQLKLKQAKILVVGSGGLGCPILQYLSAAGIGTIGIIDDDEVDQSNLQRQILFRQEDIGKNKAESAAKSLKALNPFVEFNTYTDRLSSENALELFDKYDIIIDGTDNFQTRYLINDAAVITNKPIVFGSIFKFDGQVSVLNYKNGPTYRCLYPTPPKPDEVPNCSEIGVLGVLPGIIGSLQANEALKIVLELGNVLSGKLLTYNALTMQQMILSFQKNESIKIKELENNYLAFCGIKTAPKEISYEEYKKDLLSYNVLDVRTAFERNQSSIESFHIPLSELPNRLNEVPSNKDLMVLCQSGTRSKQAISIIKENGFTKNLTNLKGGLMFSNIN
jgi:adenylyltransferase/sulfurtransferase